MMLNRITWRSTLRSCLTAAFLIAGCSIGSQTGAAPLGGYNDTRQRFLNANEAIMEVSTAAVSPSFHLMNPKAASPNRIYKKASATIALPPLPSQKPLKGVEKASSRGFGLPMPDQALVTQKTYQNLYKNAAAQMSAGAIKPPPRPGHKPAIPVSYTNDIANRISPVFDIDGRPEPHHGKNIYMRKAAPGIDPLRISDEVIPWGSELSIDIPDRPSPIFELGQPYFDVGQINKGVELPTGAVWQPGFLLFGQWRTALQSFENTAGARVSEFVNRLDLFANLRLTGTERIFASFRPIDQDGDFLGKEFEPDNDNGFKSRNNFDLLTLFFEGDFDQVFPNWLNPTGAERNDYSFTVGRQPVFIQEGFLINDVIESVAIGNNNIHIPGVANAHATALYGWHNINRDNLVETDSRLYGLFSEVDLRDHRVQLDLAYVTADEDEGGDGAYIGLSSFQRIDQYYTTFRINHSIAMEGDDSAEVSDGTLLYSEVSWEPDRTDDIMYLNSFWAIDNYSTASRDVAGPLGDVGFLFAAKNIGGFNAPIANNADDAFGGALGYQMLMNHFRTQLIGEVGFRVENEPVKSTTYGATVGFEQGIGQHTQLFVDAFAVRKDIEDEFATGLRTELSYKF